MNIWNGSTNIGSSSFTYTNDTQFHIYIYNITNSASGYTIKIYFDSSTTTCATLSSTTPINNRTVINNYIGNLNANIRQFLMYNYALSANDMTTVFNTLKAKCNIVSSLTLPPGMLKSNSTILCNGSYISSSSSGTNSWYAFGKLTYASNTAIGGNWQFQSSVQYNSSGVYIGNISTISSSVTYNGEWIQLRVPSPTSISSYWVNSSIGSSPYTIWTLMGSKDGSTWTNIDTVRVYSVALASAISVTKTDTYTYFRIVFTQMCPTITLASAYNIEFYQ